MKIKNKNNNKAFTLIETLFAILLVGMAVCAIIVSLQASTSVNADSINISKANELIKQFYELSLTLAKIDPESGKEVFGPEENDLSGYDDLDDFDGLEFSPPINAARVGLEGYTNYKQKISVYNVAASDLATKLAPHQSGLVKVEVAIYYGDKEVASETWLRAD